MIGMVRSMTAFGRGQMRAEQGEVVCEIRSVNHRYLEITLRLPDGLGWLEGSLRERLGGAFARGKVDCQLVWRRAASQEGLVLDRALVAELVRVSEALRLVHPGLGSLGMADLLRWPGVVAAAPGDPAHGLVQAAFEGAVAAAIAHREREGERLNRGLREKLGALLQIVGELGASWAGELAGLRARWTERVVSLGQRVDPARLEQEIVLLAQRSDVEEELERLRVHLTEVEEALATGGPVGRRLDFLMQELNREANTIASKGLSARVTGAAVAMKVLIEQMREQVQNIE